MIHFRLSFLSCGKRVSKTVVISDALDKLSSSKSNQAVDICDAFADGYWSILFDNADDPDLSYEIEFKYEDFNRRLIPIKAITWSNVDDIILDVQDVICFSYK